MNRLLYAFVMVVTCAVGFRQFQLVAYGQEADALSNLKKAKEDYEKAREAAVKIWEKQIERLIKAPKHALDANQAIDLNQKLKAIKSLGDRYDGVPDMDAVLGPATDYYGKLALPRWKLYLAYEAMNRQLQHGKFKEVDQEALQQETSDFMQETEELDKIKPGNHFNGERHDPALNINVPIHLKITERNGHEFRGRVDFNNGDAIFNVRGIIRGLELQMMKEGVMVRGKERYFEYSGYVIGNRMLLKHQGITTGKKFTVGWSWMKKK